MIEQLDVAYRADEFQNVLFVSLEQSEGIQQNGMNQGQLTQIRIMTVVNETVCLFYLELLDQVVQQITEVLIRKGRITNLAQRLLFCRLSAR